MSGPKILNLIIITNLPQNLAIPSVTIIQQLSRSLSRLVCFFLCHIKVYSILVAALFIPSRIANEL
jgi:hypothetical protein